MLLYTSQTFYGYLSAGSKIPSQVEDANHHIHSRDDVL